MTWSRPGRRLPGRGSPLEQLGKAGGAGLEFRPLGWVGVAAGQVEDRILQGDFQPEEGLAALVGEDVAVDGRVHKGGEPVVFQGDEGPRRAADLQDPVASRALTLPAPRCG